MKNIRSILCSSCLLACLLFSCDDGSTNNANNVNNLNNVTAELCDDTLDNDGDGATDCDDTDCAAAANCILNNVNNTNNINNPVCGNALQETGEDCDGDDLGGQDCLSLGFNTGTIACNADCTFDTSACVAWECGNLLREGAEDCDGDDLGGQDCLSQGFDEGTIACNADCTFDTSACVTWACGNNIPEGVELCDGAILDGTTCADLGFDAGDLYCGSDCTFDTSACVAWACGNGIIEGLEDCEGDAFNGETCTSLGFDDGVLYCDAACGFDTSSCITWACGNNFAEGYEVCDGTDVSSSTCVDFGYLGGTLGCTPDCGNYDFSGCINDWWSEDFEAGAALGAEWVLSGNANWFGSANMPHAGLFAGECGNIADSQISSMEVTLNFVAPGTVSFWYRVSSESGWDFLRFFIDGVQQSQWSGNLSWTQSQFYNVPAGTHTLRWTYTKDGSVSSFFDTAWIDDIITTSALLP